MGKITFLLLVVLLFLPSCHRTPNSLRLLSDSPWLWKATELYNRERSGQKPLIILDYQENIRAWLVSPAYKKANIIVSTQAIAHFDLNYLSLDLPDIVDKKVYTELRNYKNDYFAPVFFEMPLYLVPKNDQWASTHALSFKKIFEMTSGQTSDIVKSPLLLKELLKLSPQLTPQLQIWRQKLEELPPLQITPFPWYLQLQRPDSQLPIVPVSLENYKDFNQYGKAHYRPILLVDDSLTWQPRTLGLIALSSEQSRSEKLESRKFLSWITSYDTQDNLASLKETSGMLGAWSIFPEVNARWIAAKEPELANLFKKDSH